MPITPYLKAADGSLHALARSHCDDEERELQSLVASNPDLLPGEQINPEDPRRWLVVGREASITDPVSGYARWALDLLLADQDAVPTLVEVKRFEDTRSRREVVGQMFEYAANGPYYWTTEQLRTWAEGEAEARGGDLEREVAGLQPAESPTAEEYFESVRKNLDQGRLRIVFFLEEAPVELKALVAFLNAQMERTEVLLVEAGHYRLEGAEVVIPQLFGYSEQAHRAKRGEAGIPRQQRSWDWETFEEDMKRRGLPSEQIEAVARLFSTCKESAVCEISWGRGKSYGSFIVRIPTLLERSIFFVMSDGSLVLNLEFLSGSEEAERIREDLVSRIQAHYGFEGKTDKHPGFSFEEWRPWAQEALENLISRGSGK